MARLSLRLLGDFEARLGSGPPLRLRARKTQALLAYLASSPGQTHSRDKLASLLWGDSSQSQARSRLRGSLFVLRRTLASADPPCLVLDGDAVALNVDTLTLMSWRSGDSSWCTTQTRWPKLSSFTAATCWRASPSEEHSSKNG